MMNLVVATLVLVAILIAALLAAAIQRSTGDVDLGLVGAMLWLGLAGWLFHRLDGWEKGRRAAS